MKNHPGQMIVLPVVTLIALGLAGCKCMQKEHTVTLDQISARARATVTQQVGNGHVDKITKEIERNRVVYDVEATVSGKHMEYLVADNDGTLLGTEVPIEFSALPEQARAAAEKYFGTSTGLTAMKGVEYGETQYEITGRNRDGKLVEVTFDPEGKPRS